MHPEKEQLLLPPSIVREKGDASMIGLEGTGIKDQHALDIPEECARNWIILVYLSTKAKYK